MMGVKFIGNPEDHTGYGRASLYMLEAMNVARVPVYLKSISFLPNKVALPLHISNMKFNNIQYDTVFIELTPDHYPLYREEGKRNIGYFFWETDRIPRAWVDCCNSMNEIWVPCPSNKEACINSGVSVPIKVVPQPTPRISVDKKIWLPNTNENTYVFYSIFQWTERKNPACLLRAYWTAFHQQENVILVLKTYAASDNAKDVDMIRENIVQYKNEMALKYRVRMSNLGRVYFISKIISDEHILAIHNTGHCFVTAARGEGWNIPAALAVQLNQPIISPSYGGIVDFMSPNDYMSVECKNMIPVSGMPWIKWYENDQKWCDPSYTDMARKMKYVYANKIYKIDYSIKDQMAMENVGKVIKNLLLQKSQR